MFSHPVFLRWLLNLSYITPDYVIVVCVYIDHLVRLSFIEFLMCNAVRCSVSQCFWGLHYKAGFGVSEETSGLTLGFRRHDGEYIFTWVDHHSNVC